jgi:3-oxoacyl-(acyl-carrier-protein) synthase
MSALLPIDALPTDTVPAVHTETAASEVGAPTLAAQANAAGLSVLAASAWPESADDVAAPALAGFVSSSFSPVAAEVARRCLQRRPIRHPDPDLATATATGLIVVSALGDIDSARRVATAVDSGGRIAPLMFFQCVPNAVAGYIATRWRLTGPVVCLGGAGAALDAAGLLLEDGDADEVLVIRVAQAATELDRDNADAVLVTAGVPQDERGRT